ncbi:MAG TPA: hypothetical protein VKU84_03540 [Stellaceae bacterium]|nr:hypothetical protein [Stellaceae bacterium]
MVKRPSFPVYRVAEPPRRSFDRQLTLITIVLAIIVVGVLVVRAAGPTPETRSELGAVMAAP